MRAAPPVAASWGAMMLCRLARSSRTSLYEPPSTYDTLGRRYTVGLTARY